MFIYYNRNPEGIDNADDCVCRAISTALDLDYYEIKRLLHKNSNYNSCDAILKSCYRHLLENDFGLKSHYGRGKTVAEIAHRYPHNNVIMRVYAHLTSSVCGNVYDLFDCTEEIVDEYWVVR